MAQYDRFHREIPDKTPVAMPLGYERPEPLESMIARMIRVESLKAKKEGKETFEESDDFSIEDDEEVKFTSDHQFTDLQEEELVNPKPKQSRKPSSAHVAGASSNPPEQTAQTPPAPPSGKETSQPAQPMGAKP